MSQVIPGTLFNNNTATKRLTTTGKRCGSVKGYMYHADFFVFPFDNLPVARNFFKLPTFRWYQSEFNELSAINTLTYSFLMNLIFNNQIYTLCVHVLRGEYPASIDSAVSVSSHSKEFPDFELVVPSISYARRFLLIRRRAEKNDANAEPASAASGTI